MGRIYQEIQVNQSGQESQEFMQLTKESIEHFLSIWKNYHVRNLTSNQKEFRRERNRL